jgi:glycosyltransferase EpsE
MDSDDLLENKKLEKQINYLTDNPWVDILSSYLIFIDEKNKFISKRSYNLNIDQAICNESPICHACAIIKKSVFDKSWLYSEDFNLAEDYELWFRFYSKGYTFAILEEYLYYYRIFDDGWKIKNLKKQLWMTINVKKYAISKYWIKFSLINYIRLYIEEFLYYVVPSFIILKLFILIKWK